MDARCVAEAPLNRSGTRAAHQNRAGDLSFLFVPCVTQIYPPLQPEGGGHPPTTPPICTGCPASPPKKRRETKKHKNKPAQFLKKG